VGEEVIDLVALLIEELRRKDRSSR